MLIHSLDDKPEEKCHCDGRMYLTPFRRFMLIAVQVYTAAMLLLFITWMLRRILP